MVDIAKYPVETFYIKTEDDYIVTLLRIRGITESSEDTLKDGIEKFGEGDLQETKDTVKPKPAALILHGIMCNGDEWLLNSPENVLPYRLASEGYDVWIGCHRGSRLSNAKPHVTFPRNSRKYWDFSIDDLVYDLTAMIDFILETTGNESLHFVGHSLGNTVFFIMMHLKPSYNSNIKVMAALAPAVYGNHVSKICIKLGSPFVLLISKMRICYKRELFGKSCADYTKTVLPCTRSDKLAVWFMRKAGKAFGIMGGDQINDKERFKEISKHSPGSTSVKTFCHGMQCWKSGNLQAYDYGRNQNLKRYGQVTPPIYDLKSTIVPVVTFTSSDDGLIPAKDVAQVAKELPNLISHNEICETSFHHVDFMYGKDVNKLVYDKVVNIFKNISNETK